MLHEHGRLACEACGFDFAERYGELGEGFVDFLLLLGHLLVHRGYSAVQDVLLLFNSLVLINSHDLIGDVGRFLWVGVEDANLQKISIAHFSDV